MLRIGKLDVVNISILPKFIHGFNIVSNKILALYRNENEEIVKHLTS
jgi:hypothetical protein